MSGLLAFTLGAGLVVLVILLALGLAACSAIGAFAITVALIDRFMPDMPHLDALLLSAHTALATAILTGSAVLAVGIRGAL